MPNILQGQKDLLFYTALPPHPGTLTRLFSFCSLPGGTSGKEPACQCRRRKRHGSIPGSGRSPGGGHGYLLQCSYLENPIDRRHSWATVHGVAQSPTRLKRLSTHGWAWKTLFLAKVRSFLLQRPFALGSLHIPSSFESALLLLLSRFSCV